MSFSKYPLAYMSSIMDGQPRRDWQHLLFLILICTCNIAALPFFLKKVLILNCSNDKLSIRKLLLASHQTADVLFEVPVWNVSSEVKTKDPAFNNIMLCDYVSIQLCCLNIFLINLFFFLCRRASALK